MFSLSAIMLLASKRIFEAVITLSVMRNVFT